MCLSALVRWLKGRAAVKVSTPPGGAAMYKNGSSPWTTGQQWQEITNWLAADGNSQVDTIPLPGGVSDAYLMMPHAISGAAITASVSVSGGISTCVRQVRVRRSTDNAVLAVSPEVTGGSGVVTASGTADVNKGDLLCVEMILKNRVGFLQTAGTIESGPATTLTVSQGS